MTNARNSVYPERSDDLLEIVLPSLIKIYIFYLILHVFDKRQEHIVAKTGFVLHSYLSYVMCLDNLTGRNLLRPTFIIIVLIPFRKGKDQIGQ
jgi:hypothetical protein